MVEHCRLITLVAIKAQIDRQRGKSGIGWGKDGDVIRVAHRVGQTRRVQRGDKDVEVVRACRDIDDILRRHFFFGVALNIDGQEHPVDALNDAIVGHDIRGHDGRILQIRL